MSTDNERIAEIEARTGPKKRPYDRHAYYREDIEFLLALLKRKTAALEEAKRFVKVARTRIVEDPDMVDEIFIDVALARINSLEKGTADAK